MIVSRRKYRLVIERVDRELYEYAFHPGDWKVTQGQNQGTEILLSCVLSSIHRTFTKVGHRAIILLQIDRALGNAKYRLPQRIRKSKPLTRYGC